MTLYGLTILFEVSAATMAVPAARLYSQYRPLAAFLVGTTIANVARIALISQVLNPARDAMRAAGLDPAIVPFTGVTRLVAHMEPTLFLLWPAGVAALSIAVFLRRRPWPVAVVWALASIALAAGYPTLRRAALARCYTAAELASLLVGLGCFLSWLPHRRERHPGLHTTVVMLLIAVGFTGLLLGPWRSGIFDKWALAQIGYAVTYAVIFVLEGGVLWIKPSSSPPSSPSS